MLRPNHPHDTVLSCFHLFSNNRYVFPSQGGTYGTYLFFSFTYAFVSNPVRRLTKSPSMPYLNNCSNSSVRTFTGDGTDWIIQRCRCLKKNQYVLPCLLVHVVRPSDQQLFLFVGLIFTIGFIYLPLFYLHIYCEKRPKPSPSRYRSVYSFLCIRFGRKL